MRTANRRSAARRRSRASTPATSSRRAAFLSPDFFDADNYPAIKFESTDVRRDGDTLTVDGELTIKDNTRHSHTPSARSAVRSSTSPISEKIGIDLETKVDRTEFGLNWNAPLPKGGFAVDNEVTVSVHLELVRAEA